MKLFLKVFAVLFFIFTMTSCATRAGVGEVGIKVSMAGSARGVQDIPLQTGWIFYFPPTTNVIVYPTYVQTAVWTH